MPLTNGESRDGGASPQHPACDARAGRRTVPACLRPRARPGGARPRGRHRRRCGERRRAGRRGACGIARGARARRHARSDEPPHRARRSRGDPPCRGSAPSSAAPDVVHGHGAKGGAFARLAPRGRRSASTRRTAAACTTAGARRAALFYLAAERVLKRRTDLFLFESAVSAATPSPPRSARRRRWCAWCTTASPTAEFAPVKPRAGRDRSSVRRRVAHAQGRRRADRGAGAADSATGRNVTATIVGDGADRGAFEARSRQQARQRVRFLGAKPARRPSRSAAAGGAVAGGIAALCRARGRRRRNSDRSPRDVGGIPEIFGPGRRRLVPPDDPAALARAIAAALQRPRRAALGIAAAASRGVRRSRSRSTP